MAEAETHRRELKNTGYEIFIGILSVLSIVNLVLLYTIQNPSLDTVLWVMNAILSGIFLVDFTYGCSPPSRRPTTSSAHSAGLTFSPVSPSNR